MKLKQSENIWVLGIFLGATGLLAALTLTLVSRWTAKPIAEAQRQNQMAALKKLSLPEFDNDITSDSVNIGNMTFMAARKDGKLTGIAAKGVSNGGYGGAIEALVGFDASGNITAVQILSHKETPGLGAAVCERKFQKTITNFTRPTPDTLPGNRILDQFNRRNAADSGKWKISKDGGEFEFRTGATVTSRAVVSLVNGIAANFRKAKELLTQEKK